MPDYKPDMGTASAIARDHHHQTH